MAPFVLTQALIRLGGYDLSGQHNSITLDYAAEILDETSFNSGQTRKNRPGLKTFQASGKVFWDSNTDLALFNRIGAIREVFSVSQPGTAEGDRAFFNRTVSGTYNPIAGEVGALGESDVDLKSANTPLVRGVLAGVGTKVATGTGAANQLGAVGSTQRLYAALHVVGTPSGTLDVVIESDDAVGFPSPTTVLTFSQFTTTIGAEWQEVAGPITDTYFRAKWTIGGGSPSYDLMVVIGIQ